MCPDLHSDADLVSTPLWPRPPLHSGHAPLCTLSTSAVEPGQTSLSHGIPTVSLIFCGCERPSTGQTGTSIPASLIQAPPGLDPACHPGLTAPSPLHVPLGLPR
uniref:Uncharacterized protein n=1 Tax=Knipowitschia caucasica TaxID=637954 RepID=A0AAV2JWJ5_KNICA